MEEWIAKQHFHKTVHSDAVTVKTDIFSLPLPLFLPHVTKLHTITEDADESQDTVTEQTVFAWDKVEGVKYAKGSSKGLTCRTCGLTFSSSAEQQSHFSSTYHNFNLKRKLKDKPSVTMEEYLALTALKKGDKDHEDSEDDEEHASDHASDSEASDDDNDELLKGASDNEGEVVDDGNPGNRYLYEDQDGRIVKVFNNINGAIYQIQANVNKPWHFSVNIALFRASSPLSRRDWNHHANTWSEFYHQLQYCRQHPLMAVFILRSGRFAGAIYDNQNKKNPLLIHKVIRRYTVRAKAGGGQSSHDNKGSKAKSMGAQLRRYGEKALKEDVQNVLTLWEDYLQHCGLILIATTKPMRGILFENEETVNNSAISLLKKEDDRVIYVPFVVDKPTLESANSIRDRCIQVTISSGAMEQQVEVHESKVVKKFKEVKEVKEVKDTTQKVEKLSLNEEEKLIECPFSKEIIAACNTSNDAVSKKTIQAIIDQFQLENGDEDEDSSSERFCQGWKLSAVINLPESLESLTTPLHIAAANSMPQTVQCLLLAGANPEQVDYRGRTPYFLADNKDTRDAFRKARAEVGEEKWNWTKAGVPEPLTDEKIAQQKQKEKEKKKRAQQRKKEQKAKEEQEAKDREISMKLQEELRKQEQAEMEAKLKEKAGNCALCSKSLFKHDFYEVLGQKCCSTDCVAKLRRKLAADAALARFK